MKFLFIAGLLFLWCTSAPLAASFYGSLSDPASSGHISIDRPDKDRGMLFLEEYSDEYEVNILQWEVEKDGSVWMELEFDPAVESPKALDVGSIEFRLDKKDSENFRAFMRPQDEYGTE